MWLQILFYISIAALAQGLFLGIVLLLKSRSASSIFLGALVLLLSSTLIEFGREYGMIELGLPLIFWALWGGTSYLYGPFLYLFVYYYQLDKPFKLNDLLHFLPFLFYIILVVYSFQNFPPPEEEGEEFSSILLHELLYIQLTIYAYWSYRKAKKKAGDQRLHHVIQSVSTSLLFIAFFTLIVFQFLLFNLISSRILLLTHFIIIGLVYFLSYRYLATSKTINVPDQNVKKKSSSSSMEPDQRALIDDLLSEFLIKKEAYTDPNLTLNSLATQMNIPSHQLSQALNDQNKGGFYAYINELRARKACQLLKDSENDKFTLSAIGEQAGFKSRTTFITHFKKNYQQSPSEFRKHLSRNKT